MAGGVAERLTPGVNFHSQQHFIGFNWVCIGFVLALIGFELALYWVCIGFELALFS
ncbi:MAG: hypothetical protein WBC22_10610 [Sedimentisphaerales bacterium]